MNLSSVSIVIKYMEKDGLAVGRRDTADERWVNRTLTDAGRAELRVSQEEWSRIAAVFLNRLSVREQLYGLVRKLPGQANDPREERY